MSMTNVEQLSAAESRKSYNKAPHTKAQKAAAAKKAAAKKKSLAAKKTAENKAIASASHTSTSTARVNSKTGASGGSDFSKIANAAGAQTGGTGQIPTAEELRSVWRKTGIDFTPQATGVPADASLLNPNAKLVLSSGPTTALGGSILPQPTAASGALHHRTKLTYDQYMGFIYQLKPGSDELKWWQRQLYEAGYYGNKLLKDIPQGEPDAATRTAWGQLVQESLVRGVPVDQLLVERKAAYGPLLAQNAQGPNPAQTELANPANVKVIADAVGQHVVGRKLTDKELAAVTATINKSRLRATAASNALGTGAGSFQGPINEQAAAEQTLRELNPVESAATDFANTGDEFLQLLRGTGNG